MVRITKDPIHPQESIARVNHPGAGAVLTFLGVVREENRGRRVTGIEYHAYEEMAVQEMIRIEEDLRERWPGIRVDIVHRIGSLEVGEASVLITIASSHRAEGFAALRHAIDRLKESVPIWKREMYADGQAWIEGA